MRMWLPFVGIVALALTTNAADPPAPAAPVPVDPTLAQLEQVGKTLHEFTAKLTLIETDVGLQTSTKKTGQVWFQKKPNGDARIRVLFDMRFAGGLGHKEKTEYLLDPPWLTDRDYRTRNETKRQVLEPGQKLNLFKLGEGPFPMPIGQTPQDVHQQFDVKGVPPQKTDPANTVHLQLLPKKETDLARKFHSIDVWVDQNSHMPVKIGTMDVKQLVSRSTELGNIVVNPAGGLKESDFALENIDRANPPWNRHVEALQK